MKDLAERWGMTPTGMIIVVLLVVSIVGVVFMLPSQKGAPTVTVPEGFNLENEQAELEKKRAAADLNEQAGSTPKIAPEQGQAQDGTADTPRQTASMATSPVSEPARDIALLSDRVGRIDPFAPILDQQPDQEQEQEQYVAVIPDDGFNPNPMIQELDIPLTFPQPITVRTPSFSLTAISTSDSGEHFVIINNEILKKGDFVPGTQYYITSIDARSMNKVTLANTDPLSEPLTLFIKRRYGDIDAELAVDGSRTFSNIVENPAPAQDEMFMPESPANIQWKQMAPGGLPLPGSRAPRSATGTVEFRQPQN